MTTTIDISKTSAYSQKLMGLLGRREPFEVLASTADVLGKVVSAHAAAILRTRPFEGKWTPNEIIGHLADGEWVLGFRSRMILCEENPVILPMDQDLWVRVRSTTSMNQRNCWRRFAICAGRISRYGSA